ncbi:hypothetical protein PS659_05852 [Pseudomonas fluorescens]|uniref:Uncharacterized protein n=1 Tax=Pseudomonas fluorescens TaxID=294 RepID=A0A5E6XYD9_PSEFL|nr:hypothetical protein PS659_05852 [Pseudomonas fluorescens]
MAFEVVGVLQRGSGDARRQPELGVVGHGQRCFVIGHADDVGHRAKDLFLADAHRRFAVGKQGWREEVTLGVARHQTTAADQACTFGLADVDVLHVLFKLRLRDHRTDIGASLQCMADLDRLHALGHGFDELVVDPGGDDEAAGSGATLASGVERALYRQLDRLLEVGVVENDLRVLAAHFQLDLGLPRHAADGDLTTDANGTGEADAVDFRAVDQCIAHHAAAAHHQVEHTGREACAGDDFGQGPGATRYQVRRFEHDAVAVGQGRSDFPCRDGNREVPRGDQTNHAQGFASHFNVDARTHRRQIVAGQAQAFTGEELEDVAGAGHFTDGFRQGFALFPGQQGAELFATGEDFSTDLVQGVMTGLNAGSGPGRERGAGGVDGGVDLSQISLGVVANGVGQLGRVDVGRVIATGNPFAIDVVIETLCICHFEISSRKKPPIARRPWFIGCYCAPCLSISAASISYSSPVRSVSGARTGPAS